MKATMKNPRALIAAAVLLVAAAIAGVVLSFAGDSGTDRDTPPRAVETTPPRTAQAKLTLEQFKRPDTGRAELLISLPEARLNVPATTGGETTVLLRCFDTRGAGAMSLPTQWPLLEEFGYPLPHIHQPANRQLLNSIRRCRLTGPGI